MRAGKPSCAANPLPLSFPRHGAEAAAAGVPALRPAARLLPDAAFQGWVWVSTFGRLECGGDGSGAGPQRLDPVQAGIAVPASAAPGTPGLGCSGFSAARALIVRGEDSDPSLEVGSGRISTGCGGPWGARGIPCSLLRVMDSTWAVGTPSGKTVATWAWARKIAGRHWSEGVRGSG